mgnify:CR=1 FL=1
MNQSRYQLIALDIDGTLLNSEKEITPDTEAMVHRAFRAGKQVVLSTGRSFAELEEILQHFPEMRYGICESGALVFDRELEQPIAVHPIPLDIVCQAAEIARQRDVLIHIFQKGRPVISRHQMEQLDAYQIPYFRSMFQRYSLQVTDALDYCLALPAPPSKKSICITTRPRSARSPSPCSLTCLWSWWTPRKTSLELSATQVDKGRGLRELCAHLNIPVETTIAVGDSFNDAAILRAAGLAVGMGNAAEPVRRLCDVIVRDCDHDGVAEAIRTHLLTE